MNKLSLNVKVPLRSLPSVSAVGYKGETELLGKGVSYCATCDGFLYKDKTIAVFCGDRHFEHEVEYLAEITNINEFLFGFKVII